MINLIRSFSLLPFLQADAQPKYSIRFFFDWHQKLITDAFGWSVKNGTSLLAGVAGFAGTVLFCFTLLFLIKRIVIPIVGRKHKNVAKELTAVSKPFVWLIFWFGFSISVDFVPFPADVHRFLDAVFYVCFALSCMSIFQHALQCTASLMIDYFKRKDPENYSMNKLMLDLSMSIIRLTVWIFVILFILQEVFLLKVTHLIASAGILGLAVAFAAKDTIANIFGAFAILGGKMFRVGDSIKAGSTEGLVEEIGFRSIRIRGFEDGRLIDIPNHIIADAQIENYNSHLYRREHFCFGLVYRTTPEQLELAKKILCDIGNDLSDLLVEGKPIVFDFLLFDQSSLNLDGYVWFKASDWLTLRHSRGRFNEEVLKRFNAAGIEFAFPTSTVLVENVKQ